MAAETENQIVVYQPNETVRLDVRLENETVWLTQSQMGELCGCTTRNIRLHLKNIYAVGELSRESTTEDFSVVRQEGSRTVYRMVIYKCEMVCTDRTERSLWLAWGLPRPF